MPAAFVRPSCPLCICMLTGVGACHRDVSNGGCAASHLLLPKLAPRTELVIGSHLTGNLEGVLMCITEGHDVRQAVTMRNKYNQLVGGVSAAPESSMSHATGNNTASHHKFQSGDSPKPCIAADHTSVPSCTEGAHEGMTVVVCCSSRSTCGGGYFSSMMQPDAVVNPLCRWSNCLLKMVRTPTSHLSCMGR
jgi:hypothetical protein